MLARDAAVGFLYHADSGKVLLRLRGADAPPNLRLFALWRRSSARVDDVEPTNNAAERALRQAVLWRKGCLGPDSEAAGSRYAERLRTVAASCRQQRLLLNFLGGCG